MPSHFDVRILSREGPLDTLLRVISPPFPRIDFMGKRVTVGQAPIKALAVKDADFDFRHVQPTGVLWRVVKDDAAQQFVRDFDPEHLLETLTEVSIEIVEDQMDAACFRIDLFKQILNKGDEVGLGAMIGDLHGPSSALGRARDEQVTGTPRTYS
jgi:hypothetical protein